MDHEPLSLGARIHFIGIGGIGMSGLAHLCLKKGLRVQGSSLSASDTTQGLGLAGAEIFLEHDYGRLPTDLKMVVISSAIKADNPELKEALQRGVPIIHRSDLLRLLVGQHRVLAVTGTHGKTTTSSLLGHVMKASGCDPLVITGGVMQGHGSTIFGGKGNVAVVEADESDKSHINFTSLTGGIITNIEKEHMENYQGDLEVLLDSFYTFGQLCQDFLVVCGEDKGVQQLLARKNLTSKVLTYGFDQKSHFVSACCVTSDASGVYFDVEGPWGLWKRLESRLWGVHNVLNALAVISVAFQMGVSEASVREGLRTFKGVQRRMTVRGSFQETLIIDDYGHHPTEIEAVLATLRGRGFKNIYALCQPHRYSRLKETFEAFSRCFEQADHVILMPVYGAGEAPLSGIHTPALAEAVRKEGRSVSVVGEWPLSRAAVVDLLKMHKPDVLVCLGAGSVTEVSYALAQEGLQQTVSDFEEWKEEVAS